MAFHRRSLPYAASGILHRRSSNGFRAVLVCLALLVLQCFGYAESSIVLDPLNLDLDGNSTVKFTFSVATPGVQIDEVRRMKMRPYPTDDKVYSLYVAFDKTAPTTVPNEINYYLYSQPVAARDKAIFTEYVVAGSRHGTFSDQWRPVRFHLQENGLHHGSIELPIPSSSNQPLISVDPDKGIEPIYLSSPTHKMRFAIKSLIDNFEVDIHSAELTANNDDFWNWSGPEKRYSAKFDSSTPGPPFALTNGPLTASVTVEANIWKALMASAYSLKADQPSDVLLLTIRHNSSPGGAIRALPAKIGVRFRPPWWSLLLSACFGSLLGSSLTLFFPETWKGANALRTIGSAALLTVIAEIIGMLLFMSDQSDLVIAGFKLNPTELLPALVLGIVVGVSGLKVLDSFKIQLPTR